ncbi:MAG: 2OG-Fe(II) oxygenase [Pseudomonadota bacterium]|nr:2OG-Fe(II) oxygenase [Pseudomonadota bacterium]
MRRAWQLSPGRVQLQDPHWNRTLGTIVADVARGLGVDGAVTGELYKMLVYDAGGFFVPHRDTEKAPHMFGTLVIVLPSTYQGGELVVRHGGREVVLPLPGEDVARHEATGNGGASFDRTYRRAALVVWPRGLELGILAQAPLASLVPALGPLIASPEPAVRHRALALATAIVGMPRLQGVGRIELLRLLLLLGDAALVARFVGDHLRHAFDAAESVDLLAAHALLGGEALAALVASVFELNALTRAPVCLDLLDQLATLDVDAARAAAPALLERLPGDPAAVVHLPEYSRPKVDAAWLARLYTVLARLEAPALLDRAVAYTVAHLAPAHLDTVVLPALLAVGTDGAWRAPLAQVHAACVMHLQRRVAEPCSPPLDWARAAPFTCRCDDCAAARAFLADPRASRWELKAVQGRRAHVESQLAGVDVDTHTARKGSPHQLVCVKNQRSYDRRAAQRAADRAALAALGVG